MNHIGILGVGKLATAILTGLKNADYPLADIHTFHYKPEKVANWIKDETCFDNSLETFFSSCPTIMVALKPQKITAYLKEHQHLFIKYKPIIVSIAVGFHTSQFEKQLAYDVMCIRAIPNVACATNLGVIGLYANKNTSADIYQQQQTFWGHVGSVLLLKSNEQVDACSAISASGPAYVAWFLQMLYESAEQLGFDTGTAEMLAQQTLTGSLSICSFANNTPQKTLEAVCSSKGTTQSALEYLDNNKVKDLWINAIKNAYHRANEINANQNIGDNNADT